MELASDYSGDTSSELPSSESEYLSSIAEQQDEALAAARLLQQMGGGSELRTSQKQTGSIASSVIPTHSLGFSFVNEPDLTYYCGLCQLYINLTCMKDHKAFHWALTTLQYSDSRMPKDVVELATRRRFLIKLMVQQQKAGEESRRLEFINRIDEAYELLKQDLEDTFEQYRKVNEKVSCAVSGRGLPCSLDAVKAIGVCGSTNARWKSDNEDAAVFQDHFGNDAHKAFLAIYDGHNGRYAAAMAANELHHILLNRMSEFDPAAKCVCAFNMLEQNDVPHYLGKPWPTLNDPVASGIVHRESVNDIHQVLYHCKDASTTDSTSAAQLTKAEPIAPEDDAHLKVAESGAYGRRMLQAVRDAYQQTDQILSFGQDEKSRVRWSGASALTLVLADDSKNARAAASAAAAADVISHQATDEADVIARIYLGNAGNVQAVLVQDDGLQVVSKKHTGLNRKERTRVEAAGGFFSDSDRELRVNGVLSSTRGLGNHGDPRLKRCISCEPHVGQVKVTSRTQFMILASNGVWEVFTPQEATDILLQMLPANRIPTPGDVSPSILKLLQSRIGQAKPRNSDATSLSGANRSESPTAASSDPSKSKRSAHGSRGGVKWQQGSQPFESGAAPQGAASATSRAARSEPADDCRPMATPGKHEADANPVELKDTALNFPAEYDHRELAKDMAERLCQAALLAGSKDNVTVMVVLFPAIRV